jgi:hypothetical protein
MGTRMTSISRLLAEITLGSITPYATQFTWQRHPDTREARISTFSADGITVEFIMMQSESDAEASEWSFGIVMPTADGEGRTVAHHRSQAVGRISYLRLMSTVAEALLDFCTQWQPDSIDITASDTSSTQKEQQKSRIYREFLAANTARIAAAGYRILDTGGRLYVVRRA